MFDSIIKRFVTTFQSPELLEANNLGNDAA